MGVVKREERGKTWLTHRYQGQRAWYRCLWACSRALSLLEGSSMLCRLQPLCIDYLKLVYFEGLDESTFGPGG